MRDYTLHHVICNYKDLLKMQKPLAYHPISPKPYVVTLNPSKTPIREEYRGIDKGLEENPRGLLLKTKQAPCRVNTEGKN